ncbi:MAG TPA: chemotaxis protein CheW [Candidatus Wallbacteria bacterium]|nr:MAG: Chemotaxis protein CheW [bacterium ADurb.Bin243]HOD40831.1 chemotaxis protein CheW [Candidatus Wallbacteria bacterium]HPG57892.1 chemotaxis protein CheW [Candidatus Wallbacteria bacterium]
MSGDNINNYSGFGSIATAAKKIEGGKFLTFYLGNEEYGIQILKVQEIIGIMEITPVPRTPDFIKGVINLRGHIIPVIYLRSKFGMPEIENTEQTCIIVVKTRNLIMGLIVDRVCEVSDIPTNDIDEAPSFGTFVNTEYILGIGKFANKVKLLLDIDKVITAQEYAGMSKIVENIN